MNEKQRQRQRDQRVPSAGAPNWLLVLVAGGITAVALITRTLI